LEVIEFYPQELILSNFINGCGVANIPQRQLQPGIQNGNVANNPKNPPGQPATTYGNKQLPRKIKRSTGI
jgi:hypothetical protein